MGAFMVFVVVEFDFYVYYVCMLLDFSPPFGFGARRDCERERERKKRRETERERERWFVSSKS